MRRAGHKRDGPPFRPELVFMTVEMTAGSIHQEDGIHGAAFASEKNRSGFVLGV